MNKLFTRFFGSILVLVAAGFAIQASAQSVSGSIANGTATRGRAVRATVVLAIPGGYHVNSNRPDSEFSVPTTVKPSGSGLRFGSVSYPRGTDRKFSFSNETINVYEGRIAFRFNVIVPANFKGNRIAVKAAVKYQACTNEVCYPPTTKYVTLTARVR